MAGVNNCAEAARPALRSAERAVLEGGGKYVGIQPGSLLKGIPDLVLFNDPLTRTTLALVVSATPITAQQVRARIAQSRSAFAEARQRGGVRRHQRQFAPRRDLWSMWAGCEKRALVSSTIG